MSNVDPEQALRRALAEHPDVVVAWLFGSRARGEPRQDSDWDVAIKFAPSSNPWSRLELADVLARAVGVAVDVVDIERAPIELAAHALEASCVLHCTDEVARVDTEVRILARAHDLAPVLRRQRAEILQETDHERAVARYREALGTSR